MRANRLKLPEWAVKSFCCPACGTSLVLQKELQCLNEKCKMSFPVVKGIPVLIDPEKSEFDITKIKDGYHEGSKPGLSDRVFSLAPKRSVNIKGGRNYIKFAKLLIEASMNSRVLVLGGRILGKGMEKLFDFPIELIETDVSFGPRTMAIVDAHNIPFVANSFDGVVIQAVLEHVADPYLCVNEIHRVLKPKGLVYAETAFMQQEHEMKFDFTRFTLPGYRRLFSRFQEVGSGAVCGTGMALLWSYEYFLMSLTKSYAIQMVAKLWARITGFWLKYFDYFTIDNPATLRGASGYYFLGRKLN